MCTKPREVASAKERIAALRARYVNVEPAATGNAPAQEP
jgi:hypothetical protein